MTTNTTTSGKCPVMHGAMTATGTSVMDWWPNALNLDLLHQHDKKTTPIEGFDYRKALENLDVDALKADMVALMTPVVKAFLTDCGVEVANLGIQVLGGHGFIRANGQEQYARDVRITPIYEGTNGVQALDLLGRKVFGTGGKSQQMIAARIVESMAKAAKTNSMAIETAAMARTAPRSFVRGSRRPSPSTGRRVRRCRSPCPCPRCRRARAGTRARTGR